MVYETRILALEAWIKTHDECTKRTGDREQAIIEADKLIGVNDLYVDPLLINFIYK